MSCLHGGSCVGTGIDVKCTCPPLFTGARCEAKRKYTSMFGVLYGGINLWYIFKKMKYKFFLSIFITNKRINFKHKIFGGMK